ncbi:hypothetical protein E0765_04885 [Sulfuricurvum sp. IAE1]|uniref:antA/AntB antirepressor family protein n=1 Tax=Sulfuricurvum sp. IAE1 TaxID=2546102 RepID=UPI00104EB1D4|nr:hypothetical protein E0765_04885 [Sulfuricurvum sp. IAE1]
MSESTGGRPSKEYIISIEMAKHLAMMEKTGKGFEVRQYFIRCEEELQRKVQAKPMSQLEILQQRTDSRSSTERRA